MKRLLAVLVAPVFLTVACAASCQQQPSPSPEPTTKPTPLLGFDCGAQPRLSGLQHVAGAIAGRYIVVLKQKSALQTLMATEGVTEVTPLKQGYAARLAAAALAKMLTDPNVEYVQEDGVKSIPERTRPALKPEAVSSWGLDRIDQRDLPLDFSFDPAGDGAGVNIAIIDTGIDATNEDFKGRLGDDCFTAIGDRYGCGDGHGHGTHVSGTAAGTTFGIAKKAKLWASRVLDANGSGSDSGVIKGIEWVAAKKAELGGDWVANMSLGGGDSPALNRAVCDAIAAGVTFAVAAGNEGADADTSSPARVRQAITVGASDRTDTQASFSNYGQLLDIYAPGVDITSDQPGGATATWSGTSMATPHVTGVAALYLQKHPGAEPGQVRDAIVGASTTGHLKGLSLGSPDLLLYARFVN